jgi:2-polyprenyl-3-methyl-5-hydroxy-6-metoxy-1,4-benzoquinol methylase
MKATDRFLQSWRIRKARPYIAQGARVLDIGSVDGVLFDRLRGRIAGGMGIDPTLKANANLNGIPLIAGYFPQDMPAAEPFDAITMLAVLEHFPTDQYDVLRSGCARFLKPGGKLIITVPSPLVDHILVVLKTLRLIDGMSLEEHHGYEVDHTDKIFPEPDFRLVRRAHFQLGLNNLFVFERRG